ncbi:MAG: hypothetical protein HFJ04_11070 [Lachnospiraceae bacterium]|nr:hypothetical protein [Lachnospiraceae bacterium]
MGKGKRFLAWLLSLAMVVTSVNLGTAASVKAEEVKSEKYYQNIKGTIGNTGGQANNTKHAMVAMAGNVSSSGTDSVAPSGEEHSKGGSGFGSARIGCIQFNLPQNMELGDQYTANITLHIAEINNVEKSKGEYTSVALYQTSNPDSVSLGASGDPKTFPAIDPDTGDAETNAYAYPIWSDQTITKVGGANTDVSTNVLNFDVTNAVKVAYAANKTKLVLRAQVPIAGVWIWNEQADTALHPELTIDATTPAQVTVKYVNENNDELKESKTVDVHIGSKYTYEPTEDEAVLRTEDGKIYARDTEKSLTIDEVGETDNVVTVAYKEVTIVGAEVLAPIETRVGVAPVLPEKVTALYSDHTTKLKEEVEWDEIEPSKYANRNLSGFMVKGSFKKAPAVKVDAKVIVKERDDFLLAKYSFDDDSMADSTNNKAAAAKDGSGNLTFIDGLKGKAVKLPGGGNGTATVKLPDNLLTNKADEVQDDITVSMFVNREDQGNSFAMILHATEINTNGPKGHIGLINKNGQLNVEYRKDGATRFNTWDNFNPSTKVGEWTHIAIVSKGSTGDSWLYLNGKEVAHLTGVTVKPSDLPAQNNYLGRSSWPDNDYKATYDEFSVYNTTLTAEDIKEIADDGFKPVTDAALNQIEIIYTDGEDKDNVTKSLTLPSTVESLKGSVITWESSNTDIIKNDGTVIQPSRTTGDTSVTLTATVNYGSYSTNREFDVTVKASKEVVFSGLKLAIAEAQPKYNDAEANPNIYVAATVAALKEKLDAAKAQAEKENTEIPDGEMDQVQADVDAAKLALETALKALKLKDIKDIELAAWYPLTENADDASGNNKNGENHGVTFDRDNGAAFNGGKAFSTYIDLPTDLFENKNKITLSFWAKDARGSKSNVFGVGDSKSVSGSAGGHFTINTSDPAGYFRAVIGTTGWSNVSGLMGSKSELAFAANTWAHLTIVIDGNKITAYKNGEFAGTETLNTALTGLGELQFAVIGSCIYGYNGDADYKGNVKDFRIYNESLAGEQAKAIYNEMDEIQLGYAADDLIKKMGAKVEGNTVNLDVNKTQIELPEIASSVYTDAEVTWTTAGNGHIGADGKVNLPPVDQEAQEQLKATISYKGKTKEITFNCKIFKIKRTVVFEPDNGTDPIEIIVGDGDVIAENQIPEEPVKTSEEGGWRFLGWHIYQGENVHPDAFDFTTKVQSDYHLIAVYQKTFTVTFQTGTNEVKDWTETIDEGTQVKEPTEPTKHGYEFTGWKRKIDLEDHPEADIFDFRRNITRDVTLIAQWELIEYTVTFRADGKEFTQVKTDMPNKNHEVSPLDPAGPYPKKGYTFKGWFSAATSDEPFHFAGEDNPDKVHDDLTLTAKWEQNQIDTGATTNTVTFNNGIATETVTVVQNNNVAAPYEDPTADGKIFMGWQKDGQDFDFKTEIVEDITLTAKWADSCTVNFYLDVPSGEQSEEPWKTMTVAAGDYAKLEKKPTRQGYRFVGWYKKDDADKTIVDLANTSITGNTDFIAKWEELTLTITYKATYSDDSLYEQTVTINYGTKAENPSVMPTRKGYTQDGWQTLNGTKFDMDREIYRDYTLIAYWTMDTYTVTFKDGDKTVATEQTSAEADTPFKVSAPAVAPKEGYIFEGWKTADGEVFDVEKEEVLSDMTLTAGWKKIVYTVTFKDGDETFATAKADIDSGFKVTAPDNTPTKDGYTFAGWCYEDTDVLFNFDEVIITADTTLTASWTSEQPGTEYTVTFKTDKDAPDVYDTKTVESGGKVTAPAEPTKEGFTFECWTTEDGKAFDFENTTITADITLIAKWEKNVALGEDCTVRFMADENASEAFAEKIVKSGEKVTAPETNPTKEGYTFVCWTKDGSTEFDFDTVISSNLTLIAKWIPRQPESPELIAAKSELKAAVAEAKAKLTNKNDYPADRWAALEKAIADAETAIESGDAKAVADAKAALEKAVNNFKTNAEIQEEATKAAAKADLTSFINTKKPTGSAADYTAESWAAYQKALSDAQAVLTNANATSAQITAAKAALEKAIAGLVKAAPVVKKVSKITFASKSYQIAAGKKLDLSKEITLSPKDATNKKVTYSIDKKSKTKKYAAISSKGVLTTKKAGIGKTVTVTVKSADGGASKTVKVKIMKTAVKKISFSKKQISIKAGKSKKLTVKVTPKGKTVNTKVTWKSSNTKYATVKNGKVTAKKAGKGKTVKITATATDGSKKKATIKVKITK